MTTSRMDKQDTADFRIDRNGQWFHDGAPIERRALAKLFSDRALVVEDGEYWLKTPYERYPVVVEDVPYVVTDFDVTSNAFQFVTNMDEIISLQAETVWELRDGIPYIEVRKQLYARVSRSVLYNLIEHFGEKIDHAGISFPLGDV